MMLLNGLFLFPPLPFSPPALPGRPARAGHAHYPGPGRPGSAPGFQKSGKRFSSGSRTPDDACPLGRIAPVRPGIPRFRLHSGVSMSFSLGKYTSGNASSVPGLLHLWKRALVLAFLGLLVNGTLTWTESMRYASVLGLIGFPAPLQEPASCCAAGRERLPLRRGSSWPSLPCSSSPAATSRRTAPSTHGWTGTGSPVVCMGEFLTRKARSASFPLPSCVWEDGWQGNF